MSIPFPAYLFECSCREALRLSRKHLSRAGLQIMQTFDLYSARPAPEACLCPNHGTLACDCQMMVLLVYDASMHPVTLVLHGNKRRTWISVMGSTPGTFDNTLQQRVEGILQTITPK